VERAISSLKRPGDYPYPLVFFEPMLPDHIADTAPPNAGLSETGFLLRVLPAATDGSAPNVAAAGGIDPTPAYGHLLKGRPALPYWKDTPNSVQSFTPFNLQSDTSDVTDPFALY
jgi:hypothetical protein